MLISTHNIHNDFNIFRFGIRRITNQKTRNMEEFSYINIVDLDESPGNKLVTESMAGNRKFCKCPHNLVEKVITIIDEQNLRQKYQEEPKALRKADEEVKGLKNQNEAMMKMMTNIQEKLDELQRTNIRK